MSRESYCYFIILHHGQVCCVEFDRKDINMNKLVATSLEGKFQVFDMRTQHPTKGFASVSEKVIELGGVSQMDVWLLCMGKMSKGYYHYYYYYYICRVPRGNGGTHRFVHFHSWKCLGWCLSNSLCGFVSSSKNDTGPARKEKCVFLWENSRKTHLDQH